MPFVESSMRLVARALESRLGELVDDMLERTQAAIPDFSALERPELVAASRRSCYANLRVGIDGLLTDPSQRPRPPGEAEHEARQAARLGVDLPRLLETYRVGHAVVWEHFLTESETLGLSNNQRTTLLQTASRYLFSYVDGVIPAITDAYTQERDRMVRTGEQRRVRRVRELLEGATDDEGELGYDIRATHLGVLAWGEHADDALRNLADLLRRRCLIVSYAEDGAWGWVAAARLVSSDWRLIVQFNPGPDTQVAVGDVAAGLEGFRRTHRDAQRAHLIGRRGTGRVTLYKDVAVESLSLTDETAAKEFVDRELGELGADTDRCQRLRETLLTYLGASSNASATAATLGVNDRTIAYRLQRANELLGYPAATRALELHLALRLRATLDPPARFGASRTI